MSPTSAHSYKAYSRATHTVAKTRQVVMLYDGAIRFLQQAQEAMEKKEIERRYNKLVKAAEIIMGLQSCLDFENGGDVAHILFDFYSGIDMRIMTLHRTNDAVACGQIVDELRTMRDIWNKIDRGESDAAATEDASSGDTAQAAVTAITYSA